MLAAAGGGGEGVTRQAPTDRQQQTGSNRQADRVRNTIMAKWAGWCRRLWGRP
jgi:hypothetical protein